MADLFADARPWGYTTTPLAPPQVVEFSGPCDHDLYQLIAELAPGARLDLDLNGVRFEGAELVWVRTETILTDGLPERSFFAGLRIPAPIVIDQPGLVIVVPTSV